MTANINMNSDGYCSGAAEGNHLARHAIVVVS